MARKTTTKLERIDAPEGSPFLGMNTVQLLLDGSDGAKDELYRRRYNKYVKSQQA